MPKQLSLTRKLNLPIAVSAHMSPKILAAVALIAVLAIVGGCLLLTHTRNDEGSDPTDTEDQPGTGETATTMYITVNGARLQVELSDNSSAKALASRLESGNLTLNMEDYGGFEKSGRLGFTLPRNDVPLDTVSGDVILYQGSVLAIYYDRNSYSLTPIGRVVDPDPSGLKELLGPGDVTVTLSLRR